MFQKNDSLKDVLAKATRYLSDCGLTEAETEARWLLSRKLNRSPGELWLEQDNGFPDKLLEGLSQWVLWRGNRKPYAYITGESAFLDLTLTVNEKVLIPRPETEMLVERVIRRCQGSVITQIVEVGTGSGAIAIALARAFPGAEVIAIDQSKEALSVADQNVRAYGLISRIRLLQGDFLEPYLAQQKGFACLVVANLPYVAETEWGELSPEVRHEPRAALIGGVSGIEMIARFLPQAFAQLKAGGHLGFEIGYNQGKSLVKMCQNLGFRQIFLGQDYQGMDRFILSVKPVQDVTKECHEKNCD